MNSFLRFIFHRSLPDPIPGQVWRFDDPDPFFDERLITITCVKNGYVEFRRHTTVKFSMPCRRLKAFWTLQTNKP